MLIHLSEISPVIGSSKDFELSCERAEYEIGNDTCRVCKDHGLRLHIERCDKRKFHYTANFNGIFAAACSRCLGEVMVPVQFEYEEVLDIDEDSEELDTEELLQREILMEWPAKILCSRDCKGLCQICGCNLNVKDCGCERTVIDPRMAAILDVFNSSK